MPTRRKLLAPIFWKLEKVISGGQIGADIAGVRIAKACGIPTGGFMPVGWVTFNGLKPEYEQEYGMEQALLGSYRNRTWKNVEAAHGTMRFAYRWHSPGELCTANALKFYGKPSLDIDPRTLVVTPRKAARWLRNNRIRILNVAGNADEHLEPFVEAFLAEVFLCLSDPPNPK